MYEIIVFFLFYIILAHVNVTNLRTKYWKCFDTARKNVIVKMRNENDKFTKIEAAFLPLIKKLTRDDGSAITKKGLNKVKAGELEKGEKSVPKVPPVVPPEAPPLDNNQQQHQHQ